MEPAPIVGVIMVATAAIGAVIITAIDSFYTNRKYKRDYKKRTGRDYDQDMSRYLRSNH